MNRLTGAKVDFPTGESPYGVAFDGTSIWVTNVDSNSVSKIDPATGAKTSYPTGDGPYVVAFDGTNIWVTNNGADSVSKLIP